MSLVSALEAPLSISNAIKKASRATGADFSYLLKTAARESSFNKSAKAKTSSAAGLFQFIESTWLKTVKDVGDKFGLSKYTPHIFRTHSGRYYVPNQKLRQEILQLRHNPEVSAMMAGAFTQQNSDFVESHLGREPTQGELYIAHFLGPQGAAELISLAESKPNARADRHFPRAARANQPIFYSGGRPRTVAQVYRNLVQSHMKLEATAAATPAPAAEPTPIAAKLADVQITKPVVEPAIAPGPATQVTPTEQDLQSFVYKASVKPVAASAAGEPVSMAPGVEARIVAAGTTPDAVGLLGQKGSPMVTNARVAALTHNNLGLPDKTLSDAPAGSIGAWTTIVHAPAEEPARLRAEPSAHQTGGEPSRIGRDGTERRRVRAPRLLEQSASRNGPPPRLRTASSSPRHWNDLWEQMALNGN